MLLIAHCWRDVQIAWITQRRTRQPTISTFFGVTGFWWTPTLTGLRESALQTQRKLLQRRKPWRFTAFSKRAAGLSLSWQIAGTDFICCIASICLPLTVGCLKSCSPALPHALTGTE